MAKKTPEKPEHVRNLVQALHGRMGPEVLVFGASNQTLVESLNAAGKQPTLIDIRQEALDRFQVECPAERRRLVEVGREFTGFEDRFDAVFFYDTLHHVPDKARALQQCRQSLKPGGWVVLYEPNVSSKFYREYDQFGELKDSMYKWSLGRLLDGLGFAVELMASEALLSRPRLLKPFIVFLQKTWFDPQFRILIVAQRRD